MTASATTSSAYLLGALEDDERAAFERHLASCPVCQDDVAQLRAAADALPRSVEQYAPPPSIKQALMDEVGRGRARPKRRWAFALERPRFALAAVACALLLGLVAGFALSSGGGDETRTVAGVGGPRPAGAGPAELVVPDEGGAAQLRVSAMPQLEPGRTYEVWLQRGDRIVPGPLFGVDRNGNGVGAVPGGLDGVDAVLVTRERAGGAQRPTEEPVVTAEV